jgi:hypothetical protein
MSLKNAMLKKLGLAVPVERNELGEMEVLIHKDARHHAAHGFVVASCKALNIKSGTVAVVLPDFDEAPSLTVRLLIDLQEAFHAQGWTLSHVVAWDGVANVKNSNIELEHHVEPEGYGRPQHWHAHGYLPAAEAATDLNSDVPAFLRKSQQQLGEAEGVLKFARRDSKRSLITDPNVAGLIAQETAKLSGLDDMAREAAKVRYESIAANGLSTSKSNEWIADKLSAATSTILSAHLSNAETASVQSH